MRIRLTSRNGQARYNLDMSETELTRFLMLCKAHEGGESHPFGSNAPNSYGARGRRFGEQIKDFLRDHIADSVRSRIMNNANKRDQSKTGTPFGVDWNQPEPEWKQDAAEQDNAQLGRYAPEPEPEPVRTLNLEALRRRGR